MQAMLFTNKNSGESRFGEGEACSTSVWPNKIECFP